MKIELIGLFKLSHEINVFKDGHVVEASRLVYFISLWSISFVDCCAIDDSAAGQPQGSTFTINL